MRFFENRFPMNVVAFLIRIRVDDLGTCANRKSKKKSGKTKINNIYRIPFRQEISKNKNTSSDKKSQKYKCNIGFEVIPNKDSTQKTNRDSS